MMTPGSASILIGMPSLKWKGQKYSYYEIAPEHSLQLGNTLWPLDFDSEASGLATWGSA